MLTTSLVLLQTSAQNQGTYISKEEAVLAGFPEDATPVQMS